MKCSDLHTMKQTSAFTHARHIALLSEYERVHIGCIAIYNNSIISVGWNKSKTHPLQKYYNKFRNFNETSNTIHSIHAEIDCISKIQYMDIKWDKVKIFVYREMLDGNIGMARPCEACMAYIKDMGIKNIYYTTNDGFAHEVLTN